MDSYFHVLHERHQESESVCESTAPVDWYCALIWSLITSFFSQPRNWCELTNLALIALIVAPASVSAGVGITEILIEISPSEIFKSQG